MCPLDEHQQMQEAAEQAQARDGNLPPLGSAWEPLLEGDIQVDFAQRYAGSRKPRTEDRADGM